MIPDHWYPVFESKRLRGRPVALRRMGLDLVLWRDGRGQATCMLDPKTIDIVRSSLFLPAAVTATKFSATLPTIGTRMTPRKNSRTPSDSATCSIVPTRNSLMKTMPIVAPMSNPMACLTLHFASWTGADFCPCDSV